jgi:hypothetical protein
LAFFGFSKKTPQEIDKLLNPDLGFSNKNQQEIEKYY